MLIGLTGYKGSGKSEVATCLATQHRYSRKPFAYHLKAMLGALGVPAEILDGNDEAKSQPLAILGGRTARYAMQTLGTEWGRAHLGAEFWVERWEITLPAWPYVVADDVRFDNEVRAIHRRGGIIIRVDNPRAPGGRDGHASEAGVSGVDTIIVNDGTLEDLWAKVDKLMQGVSREVYAI